MTSATIPAEQFTAIAQRSQEATTTAVRTWTETLQSYADSFSAENPLPRTDDVKHAVDAWFDLVNVLVTEQRALAKTLVDASAALGEQARAAATSVTSATSN
jgi:hypothetical protein